MNIKLSLCFVSLDATSKLWFQFLNKRLYLHFIAIALEENSIFVAVHFSMKNIYQSYNLGRAVGRSSVDNVLVYWRLHDVGHVSPGH